MKDFVRKQILSVLILVCILTGCGGAPERGMSTDPEEFPDELQALEIDATATPTKAAEATPTVAPTETPTVAPTETPTVAPTETPTVAPTETPTVAPSATPAVTLTPAPDIEPAATPTEKESISLVLNTNTMKAHRPSCSSVKDIKAGNRQDYTGTVAEVIEMGYQACKRCHPY